MMVFKGWADFYQGPFTKGLFPMTPIPRVRFPRRIFPKVDYSQGCFFPRVLFPKGDFSQGGLFQRVLFPQGTFPKGAFPKDTFPKVTFPIANCKDDNIFLPSYCSLKNGQFLVHNLQTYENSLFIEILIKNGAKVFKDKMRKRRPYERKKLQD